MEIYDMAGHLIRRLHQSSTHVFALRTKEAGLDVTPVQFAALNAIRETPGIDQAGVAARIAYDRATIGGVIDRLEQKGWITREISPRDRRARVLALTETGAAMYGRILPVVRELQPEILPGLTDEERAAFLALARKATDQEPRS
ncbi:MarR family winged helix-turn-helix transcriptional regulator [Salipiger mucosus]|uniref:Transcriptional regulator, MarR family n=1 Tax=Salipiger mucosus DSM 16094 TaxID=1123237 RepID=S9Q5Q7_9RHOB|nr:MarR family transcriptional regulator [Salipiger mucosus]EPX76696.1 Transcriptional regulator, MarR family [Salipiger mucosus DSM 16094]